MIDIFVLALTFPRLFLMPTFSWVEQGAKVNYLKKNYFGPQQDEPVTTWRRGCVLVTYTSMAPQLKECIFH